MIQLQILGIVLVLGPIGKAGGRYLLKLYQSNPPGTSPSVFTLELTSRVYPSYVAALVV
jgi:anaerobic selenocysteine-containing dehydrogenase